MHSVPKHKSTDDSLVNSQDTPDPKAKVDETLKQYFELQITQSAMDSFEKKDYIRASMLSWSYIEEFSLPTSISMITKFHKLALNKKVIDKANASTLIQYYYLISHDKELYDKLEEARKHRNSLVHYLYRSESMEKIDQLAKVSALYNINLIIHDIWDRESGEVPIPSMTIVVNARNDLRKEQLKRLGEVG